MNLSPEWSKLLISCFTVLLAIPTQSSLAGLVDTSEYSLTQIEGVWSFGSTNRSNNAEVDNVHDLSSVNNLMSDGYTDLYDNTGTAENGIYTYDPDNKGIYYGRLTFSFNGGNDFQLETLDFISSRAFSASTQVILEYQLDGGGWQNAVTTTTEDLGMHPLLSNAFSSPPPAGTTFTLNFGSVLADQFRLTFDGGNQVSIHEVSVFGSAITAVPEPSSVVLSGLLVTVGLFRRRRP
ncbi:MAG: hypothetical protein KatS3mg111_0742 [Pirellulaceae bacterium]|nr:MAG: hypothetical protein KatS3mg111_0742 [Pirellulaceae bacterium]